MAKTKNVDCKKTMNQPYEDVMTTDSEFYIAQSINEKNANVYYNMTKEELLQNLKEDQNLNEILHKDRPLNFYIDYDATT